MISSRLSLSLYLQNGQHQPSSHHRLRHLHIHSGGGFWQALRAVVVLPPIAFRNGRRASRYLSHQLRQISLNTNLQAVAVTLSLHKTITLCSLYIPPSYPLGGNELDQLISQLPSPFILIGDMNAHSTIWGIAQNNNKGNILENFTEHNELCLWNDNTQTYIHPVTESSSAIDLCSP